MQTFLPFADFHLSANSLDYRRLGKQRVETKQILQTILSPGEKRGWVNHPAVRMWRGYEFELARYGLVMSREWRNRGYNDNQAQWFCELLLFLQENNYSEDSPPWMGDSRFHLSHQSNLVRKYPDFYGPKFPGVPNNLDYVWPV